MGAIVQSPQGLHGAKTWPVTSIARASTGRAVRRSSPTIATAVATQKPACVSGCPPMPETLLAFSGTVNCERGEGPLGLTLRGAAGAAGEVHTLDFSGRAPTDLPQLLAAPRVEML